MMRLKNFQIYREFTLLEESQSKTSKELAKERLKVAKLKFKAEKLGFELDNSTIKQLSVVCSNYRRKKTSDKESWIYK